MSPELKKYYLITFWLKWNCRWLGTMYLQTNEWFEAIQCPINTSIWSGDFFPCPDINPILIILSVSINGKFLSQCYPSNKNTGNKTIRIWNSHTFFCRCAKKQHTKLFLTWFQYNTNWRNQLSVPCTQETITVSHLLPSGGSSLMPASWCTKLCLVKKAASWCFLN